ncbi:MAG: caspase family protein [Zoogloea oleivorans]|jgi:hypothetical protein|uniref:caspase family protein n=1 Tax=Zoogloea oleivorans TaxID=1552750 RepID=UPI002A36E74A|nr:caspase family protein [Zoogloea oleivorans]MDY0037317.1 caspase family protein [Zoogloea oleivorans]
MTPAILTALRSRFRLSVWIGLELLALSSIATDQAQAAERMALVMGNGEKYSNQPGHWWKLYNPEKDARAIDRRLTQLGWTVTRRENRGRDEMLADVDRFVTDAKQGGAVQTLFYFSGHGAEWDKGNYLIPVDARSYGETETENKGIPLTLVINKLKAIPGIKLALLDACRTVPRGKGADSKGLASPEHQGRLPNDTVVVFAAEAGTTADDGRPADSTGVFAAAFLNALNAPGTSLVLGDVLADTERQVDKATGGVQLPASYGRDSTKRLFSFGAGNKLPQTRSPSPGKVDHAFGPIARYSDGTTHFSVRDAGINRLMVKSCEEGTEYRDKTCVGTIKLYTLDEAMRAAEAANQGRFAGYSNWRVPDYMDLLGIYSAVYSDIRNTSLDNTKESNSFGLKEYLARNLFITGSSGLQTWMLPRHGAWNERGTNDIGDGVSFAKNGRYPLRLVRNLQ